MVSERIVAVGLLTKNDVRLLGRAFDRLWPVEETSDFSSLLRAIDDADRNLSRPRSDDHRNVDGWSKRHR